MSHFLITVEGIDRVKNKLVGEKLYGNAIRHQLDTLAQIALAIARQRAPRRTGRFVSTFGYEVSKHPVPTWSKVTFDPQIGANIGGRKSRGKPFRFGYAQDFGSQSRGPGEYHYYSSGSRGRSLRGWLSKIRPSMKGAIGSAAASISREIEGIWRQ